MEALWTPFDLIGRGLDHIGTGMYELSTNIFKKFSTPLSNIWQEIVNLPGTILSGIQEVFTFLFIPQEDYFSTKFSSMKDLFISKIGVSGNEFEELKSISSGSYNNIQEFKGTYMGKSVTFIDLSFLDNFIAKFHDIARGFMYPLLLIFNLNQVYFLIRGKKLFGGGNE